MKLTRFLVLSLTVVVLLAVGAVGFADKTEELLLKSPYNSQTVTPGSNDSGQGGSNHQNHSSEADTDGAGSENLQNDDGDNVGGHNMEMMEPDSSGGDHSGH